jgi:hypothetical protein
MINTVEAPFSGIATNDFGVLRWYPAGALHQRSANIAQHCLGTDFAGRNHRGQHGLRGRVGGLGQYR